MWILPLKVSTLIIETNWIVGFQLKLFDGNCFFIIGKKGNFSLWGSGAPLLNSVYFESSKKIKNPSQVEIDEGRSTVFDTWLKRYPNDKYTDQPK